MRCLALAALLCLTANNAFAACYPESAAAAERAAHEVKTWRALYEVYQRFRICDDGTVTNAFTLSVSTLLVTQWSGIGSVTRLAARTPKFRAFVLRHMDSSMSVAQARIILRNANANCPHGQRPLCDAIAARVRKAAMR